MPDPATDDSAEWIKRILTARVYDVAIESPLVVAPKLSARLKRSVYLKREDLQPVYSFKLRGAYHKMRGLDAAARERGVLAVSAGNHAQGVALAGRELKVDAVIVMPTTTPAIKVDAVRALGATIELFGDSYDEAASHGRARAQAEGRVFVHPYDDADVIAGQGTVALELLRQLPLGPARVYVPVGGGGLAAGMCVLLAALRPELELVAVEPDDAACLAAALEVGEPVDLAHVGLFVDGCAVKRVGTLNFALLQPRLRSPVVTVSVDEVCAAVRDAFDDCRAIVEPAGALALAGLKKDSARHDDDLPAVAILSGANLNFDRLRHVAERADIGEAQEALYALELPERKGAFLAFCGHLGKRAVTEFNYRYAPGRSAQVFVGLRLAGGRPARAQLVADFAAAGYQLDDLSDNELAGLHVRHLVGGRSELADERIYRFEFPERPGALRDFLERVSGEFNITLFHYRNHGAAYGRVLAGFDVTSAGAAALAGRLQELGFDHVDESENPAVKRFLRA